MFSIFLLICVRACISNLGSSGFLALLGDKMMLGESNSLAVVSASDSPPPMESPFVYVLSAAEKENLDAFISQANFEMPICMTDFSVFAMSGRHCYWCPALAGPKDEHGKNVECVLPCQKACTIARGRIDISLLQNIGPRPSRTHPPTSFKKTI